MKIVTRSWIVTEHYGYGYGPENYCKGYRHEYYMQLDEKHDSGLENSWKFVEKATNESIKAYAEKVSEKIYEADLNSKHENYSRELTQCLHLAEKYCLGQMLRPELDWDALEHEITAHFYKYFTLKGVKNRITEYFIRMAESHAKYLNMETTKDNAAFKMQLTGYHADLEKAKKLKECMASLQNKEINA